MVKNFLKIAGVKSKADFYKKYPTEAAFFKAHPKAMQMVQEKQEMAYGGMYAYNVGGMYPVGGGVPSRRDYGDNEEQYQADMDAYTAGLGVGAPKQVVTTTATQPIAKQAVTLNPYQGVSVYDFLTAQGKAGDYASRKGLAKTLGIPNYTGQDWQNAQMMEMIRQNPDVLTGYTPAPRTSSRSKKQNEQVSEADLRDYMMQEAQRQATANPYIMAPVATGPELPGYTFGEYNPGLGGGGKSKEVSQPSKGMSVGKKAAIATVGSAGITGAGYAAYKELKGIMDGISSGKFKPSGQLKGRLTRLKNEWLGGIGKNVKDQAEWFSSLPKEQQNILDNLDAMEISGDMHIMPKGTASRDLYTRDMLNEANAENAIMSGKETEKALQEAAEEAKVLRSANARKAAAARFGTKATKAAEAEKAVGLGTRLMEGLKGLSEAKYISPLVKGAKGFFEAFHEYGGQPGYQAGGSYNPTSINYGAQLPMFNMGATMPQAMYGMGMAEGGQMPQWLAERRFSAAGNQHLMGKYGYAGGGSIPGQTLRNFKKGSVHDLTDQDIQELINQGYTIEYL